MFEAERSRILVALGRLALSIDHVGSTSVPLLAAKPTIDIALTVTDSADETSYVPALERSDFRFVLREPDWFQHRLLRREPRLFNLHVGYIDRVRNGEEVIVTDRGRPVARLSALDAAHDHLAELIAAGIVRAPTSSKRRHVPKHRIKSKGTVSDLVAEQRR
jgi:prevent-host-death family protein